MSQFNPNNPVPSFFLASAEDFKKIPGSPIVYWVSENFANTFIDITAASKNAKTLAGMQTGDNDLFEYFLQL